MIRKLAVLALFCLVASVDAAITMPAPPPELPDTLRNFRTKEQIRENQLLPNDEVEVNAEEVEIDSAPFVPGDDSAGVIRLSSVYIPQTVIGVPEMGAAIARFYDLKGIPWDIASVRVENQGFSAETTASASELLIRQLQGAATSRLVVELDGYQTPLVFTLKPVNLEHEGVMVSTVLQTVRVRSYLGADGYLFPKIHEVPKPNPKAVTAHFENVDQSKIERTLINAVRELKYESSSETEITLK